MSFNNENIKCEICGDFFTSQKSLHSHIKGHKIFLKDYYEKYFPRKCPFCGLNIPYKNYEEYFSSFFYSDFHMEQYFEKYWDSEEAKNLALEMLKRRIKIKKLTFAPTSLEIKSLKLPKLETYIKMFGSYGKVCKLINIPMLLSKKMTEEINNDYSSEKILIDTREQKPLSFKNEEVCKLDIGDYTLPRENFTNTFIDRKSESDFKGTLSSGYNRFRKELERCRTLGCFLYILVETKFDVLEQNNHFGKHTSNLNYIFHNMRTLQHEFSDCCQFVFSGGRKNSRTLIPKILKLGDKLWNVDLQYFIDNNFIHELD